MVIEDGIIGVSHLRLPAAQAHSTGLFTGKVVTINTDETIDIY